jgi:hypothetical protein
VTPATDLGTVRAPGNGATRYEPVLSIRRQPLLTPARMIAPQLPPYSSVYVPQPARSVLSCAHSQ